MSDKKSKAQKKMEVIEEVNKSVQMGVEELMEKYGVALFDSISELKDTNGTPNPKATFTLKVSYDLSKDPLLIDVDLDLTLKNKIQGRAEHVVDIDQTTFSFTSKTEDPSEDPANDPVDDTAMPKGPMPESPKGKKGKKK